MFDFQVFCEVLGSGCREPLCPALVVILCFVLNDSSVESIDQVLFDSAAQDQKALDIKEEFLSPGRQRLVQQTKERLESGQVYPFDVPLQ